MNRRLYLLIPNVESARQVHNEFLLARIAEPQMHVIAREGLDLTDLPPSTLMQRTDLVHAMRMGGTMGGFLGLLFSAVLIFMGWSAPAYEGLTLLSVSIAGVFIGAVSASMIGINIPNTRYSQFMSEVEGGKILFVADIPVQRLEELESMIHSRHPEVSMKGIDPTIPAFP